MRPRRQCNAKKKDSPNTLQVESNWHERKRVMVHESGLDAISHRSQSSYMTILLVDISDMSVLLVGCEYGF